MQPNASDPPSLRRRAHPWAVVTHTLTSLAGGGAQAMPKQMPARIPSRRPPASRRHPAGRRRGERSTVRGQEPRRGPVSGGGRLGLASPEERGGGAGAALELEALQVDVGPVSEQRLHRLGVPAPGGQVQCAEPLLVRQVTHVGAD